MYTEKDLNYQVAVKTLRLKMDIAVDAIREINRALLFATQDKEIDVKDIRNAIGDLEMFLMHKS